MEDMSLGIVIDNPDSILVTTKKAIGLLQDDGTFDTDIIMHINTVFEILNQLGVGPTEPFYITGERECWSDFIQGNPVQMCKTYMAAKVGYMFDPPTTGPSSQAREKILQELEWRLTVAGEEGKLVVGL